MGRRHVARAHRNVCDVVELVGKALSLSATTYLEIPNPQVLGAWLNMLSRNEEADSFLSHARGNFLLVNQGDGTFA